MGLKNKKKDMTPYDMKRKPSKQWPILLPIIWGGSYLMTRQFHLKIDKVNMDRMKPPYLVLATHQGFSDYYIGPLAMFPHRAMYVSDMEGFAAFGNAIYRGIGCIPKRRYVTDYNVMKNIRYALDHGQSVVIYPESRHSNIGLNANIPKNMGRLAKSLKVPLVILSAQGSYLANPFWDEERTRKVPIRAKMECVYTVEELEKESADTVQKAIEEMLTYDEYQYQIENGIKICDAFRAEGMERALYQCVCCKTKYNMVTHQAMLRCEACNRSWTLNEDGYLVAENPKEAIERMTPSSWYQFEQQEVIHEFGKEDSFYRRYKVSVEALPNEKGFVPLGEGELTMDEKEFLLSCKDIEGADLVLHFPHRNLESVQTEFNYRKKGRCIVLSTRDCCYYIYSDEKKFEPNELQFIGEYFYEKTKKSWSAF